MRRRRTAQPPDPAARRPGALREARGSAASGTVADTGSGVGTSSTPSVFLAHSSKDKRFSRRLAQALRERGFRVWIDEAELSLGDSLFEKIGQAVEQMDFLGVVLSPSSVASPWVQRELEIALRQEIEIKRNKVLPILYRPCRIPPFLSSRLWVSFESRRRFSKGVDAIALRLASSRSLDVDAFAPWTPKAVRLGLRFRVLEAARTGPVFTEKFLEVLGRRMSEQPEKFNVNVLLAVLDCTPSKVTEEELVEFGNMAKDQLIPYLVELGVRSGIIEEDRGGLSVHDSIQSEAVDHFAEQHYRSLREFKRDASRLFTEMVRARLALRVPRHVSLAPVVTDIAMTIFDHNGVLEGLWEGALRPGAIRARDPRSRELGKRNRKSVRRGTSVRARQGVTGPAASRARGQANR